MICQAQKIDCRAFVGVKYFRFFRNRLFQQNHNCDSAGKKSQEPLAFPACFRRDSLYGHLFRIEYPDAFYEGRCVVDADHEVPLSLGVVRVNSWSRAVNYILIFGVKPILQKNKWKRGRESLSQRTTSARLRPHSCLC